MTVLAMGKTPASRTREGGSSPLPAFARKPLGLVALAFLLLVCVASFFPSLLAPDNPLAIDVSHALQGPSGKHLLGTDQLGRDVLSRLMYGGRPMIVATVEATAIAIAIGTVGGVIAGYFRRVSDRLIGWLGDLLLSIPVLVVLLVILTVDPTNLTPAMIALGVLLAPGPMRVVRAVTLEVREELYIASARAAGLSHRRILIRHVLPKVLGPVIVQGTLVSGVALLLVTGLAFLGLGVRPPQPTWGSMVSEAAAVMQQQEWLLVPTGGTIMLTVIALGLLGDSIRDVVVGQSSAASRNGRRTLPARRDATIADTKDDGSFGGSANPDSVLSVRGLSVVQRTSSESVLLVDRVSLDVQPAEILGVVGESGSGKTLTARAILNLLPDGLGIAAGEVRLDGTELVGMPSRELTKFRRGRIAYVSQDPTRSLDPSYTVGRGLREVLRWKEGLSGAKAHERARELLEAVQLPHADALLHYYPHQLSGGMAQRVAIARALAGHPKLLVADEPTTALDVTVQSEILDLLRSLRDQTRMAIMFITHNWGTVADLCDRAVVMYAGQVVEQGTVGELFDDPAHPYTAALLRCSPYFAAAAGATLTAIPGRVPRPSEWPTGCRFQDRCQFVTQACRQDPVALRPVGEDRLARCIRVNVRRQVMTP